MDYCLGEPDGSARIWTVDPDADTDGDGVLDGFGLDVDSDGLLDDLFADRDGDDTAELALIDGDDDGLAELAFTDDGTGTWAVAAERAAPLRWFGLDGAEQPATAAAVDIDGDGEAVEQLADHDGDGLADRAFGPGTAWADTDGDGRWDVRLTDDDGDTRADRAEYL
ncbi:pullulanase [Mycobacterium sp. SMC-4]|uniref:pullulanase n=1 Tax=Mycobacterium sp. SMC-4 TaxID=2857059 RepID=UPI003D0277F2